MTELLFVYRFAGMPEQPGIGGFHPTLDNGRLSPRAVITTGRSNQLRGGMNFSAFTESVAHRLWLYDEACSRRTIPIETSSTTLTKIKVDSKQLYVRGGSLLLLLVAYAILFVLRVAVRVVVLPG